MVALVKVVKMPEAQVCSTIYASYYECCKIGPYWNHSGILRFSSTFKEKRVNILGAWLSRGPISGLGMTRRALNCPAVLMDLGMGCLPKLIQWSFQTKIQWRSDRRMLLNTTEMCTTLEESALMKLLLLLPESTALNGVQGHLTNIEHCFLANGMLGKLPRCYF